VEVDALPAQVLRQMVHDCIEPHVDRHALSVTKTAEDSEREILTKFAKRQAASR
jgi:hypothetical protein